MRGPVGGLFGGSSGGPVSPPLFSAPTGLAWFEADLGLGDQMSQPAVGGVSAWGDLVASGGTVPALGGGKNGFKAWQIASAGGVGILQTTNNAAGTNSWADSLQVLAVWRFKVVTANAAIYGPVALNLANDPVLQCVSTTSIKMQAAVFSPVDPLAWHFTSFIMQNEQSQVSLDRAAYALFDLGTATGLTGLRFGALFNGAGRADAELAMCFVNEGPMSPALYTSFCQRIEQKWAI